MEQLDLRCHTPEEFAGKSVTIGGRNYTIGPKFGGDEGYAHFLINELSGLCLHIVQIGKEYLSNPSGALAASREKARETAYLRSNMLLNGEAITLPFISVIEGNGGSFELHETTWGAFGHIQDSPGRESIDLAVSQSEAGDQRSAVRAARYWLRVEPAPVGSSPALNCMMPPAISGRVPAVSRCDANVIRLPYCRAARY
jgi:hypothetical protein